MNALAGARYEPAVGNVAELRDAAIELWTGRLGVPERWAAKYEWFYRQAPHGPPLVAIVRQQPVGTLVGIAAAGRRRMRWGDNEVCAGLLADIAVLPEHRTLFPALQLQRELRRQAQGVCALLYGLPNPKAVPVFERVGYRHLGSMQRFAVVVRSCDFLARRMPRRAAKLLGLAVDALVQMRLRWALASNTQCEWRAAPWQEIDSIWRAWSTRSPVDPSDRSGLQAGTGLWVAREAAFVRWRCGEAPTGPMRFYLAYDARNLQPIAWLACETEQSVLHLRDWWSVDGCAEQFVNLLRRLRLEAAGMGVSSMSVEHCGAPSVQRALQSAGFAPRSSRPVYGLVLAAPLSAGDNLPWHLTSADEDE
jgi:hypothetical protein